jgi:excisionase family DNA binding protein
MNDIIKRLREEMLTEEPYLSASQIGKHLGLKRDTVYKKAKRGEIPYSKVGNSVRFKLSHVEAAIKK